MILVDNNTNNNDDVSNNYGIEFSDLPDEIIKIIMSFIDTTHDICKCRTICRSWCLLWPTVPQIENNVILGYHNFSSTEFQFRDLSGNIIREIIFKCYGQWCYQEYKPNKCLLRKIENPSFFITRSEDNSSKYYQKILKVDAQAGLIHKLEIPKLMITPPCVIS